MTTWDGWIFDGNDFYESVEDMLDMLDGDGRESPEYVWSCKPDYFVKADVGDITEQMADRAYEDWDPETLNGLDELKVALDRFNEANKHVCSYSPDYSKAIILTKGL